MVEPVHSSTLASLTSRLRWAKRKQALRLLLGLFSVRTYRTFFQLRALRSSNTSQAIEIQRLLDFCCARVEYYKSMLREAADEGRVEFSKLDILDKSTLRRHFADFLARDGSGELVGEGPFRIVKTNGSTGVPCSYFSSRSNLLANIACLTNIFDEYGVPAYGHLYDLGLHWNGQPVVQARMFPGMFVCWNFMGHTFDAPEPLQQCRAIMDAAKPTVIYGAPSRIVALARLCREEGVKLRPRLTITTYEHLSGSTRRFLEEAFQCRIVEIYGTSETGIASWKCKHDRFHFDPGMVALELVRADGEYAEPGEIGRVVLTPIGIRTMPLLRFDTGDLAVYPEADCPCGKLSPSIEHIEGRGASLIETAGGNLFSPFGVYGRVDSLGAHEYQIVQREAGSLEIILSPECDVGEKRLTILREAICRYLQEPTEITVSPTGEFRLTASGKRNAFVQELRSGRK